jgi:NAD(P)-dependent dehydrogenase (short-subunit alcohol dehydrogenase family)
LQAITSLKSRGITTLDLVIANAGVGGEMTPFTSIGAESLLDTMRVNTIAPLLLFQAALPLIPKGGKFVVVSTMMALTEGEMYHQAGQDAYRLSKVGGWGVGSGWLRIGARLSSLGFRLLTLDS